MKDKINLSQSKLPAPTTSTIERFNHPLSFLQAWSLTSSHKQKQGYKMYTSLSCLSFFLMTLAVSLDAKDVCPKIKPATGLKITEVLGTWYAVRGIEHASPNSNNNAKETKSCPMIKIVSKDNLIEFQWHSKDKPLKKLDLKQNKDNPGLLEPVSKKGNSKSSLQITILDNTKNVIGVTMCKPGGKTASVILNREPAFVKDEVQSVTSILGSQGLDVNNIFDRCLKNV